MIAIISLLAALLLPSLTRAREKSKTISCANNMRQIGLCPAMYDSDFRGYLFPLEYMTASGNPGDLYSTMFVNLGYIKATNKSGSAPYGREKTPFQCPSGLLKAWTTPSSRFDPGAAGANRYTSATSGVVLDNWYGINGTTWNQANVAFYRIPRDNDDATVVLKGGAIRSPSKFVWLFDGVTYNFWSQPNRLNLRHDGWRAANLLFIDGHVRSYLNANIPSSLGIGATALNQGFPDQRWRLDQD